MLEMYLLLLLVSGALISLYEDEDEKKRIINEQFCSDISGHKYVYCDVIDCVLLQELTVPWLV
jgi:hypothetical protein